MADDKDNIWADIDFVTDKSKAQDEVDHASADFDFVTMAAKQKEEEKRKEETKVENKYADKCADDFKPEERSDKHEVDSNKDDSVVSPRNASSEKLDEADGPKKERKSRKKHKRKPHKQQHHHQHADTSTSNKPPPLNLYQDQSRKQLLHPRDRRSPRSADIMSDQENLRRRGRKLHHRGQIRKFHSMEAAVEQAGRDRLEQKYEELEELLTRPLADTRGLHIPQKRLHKLVVSQQTHASVGHRNSQCNENGTIGPWFGDTVHEEEEDSHAYSTIRVLQTVGPNLHRHVKYQNKASPRTGSAQHNGDISPHNHTRESRQEERLSSKPPRPRRRKDSVESSPTSSSGASQHRQEENRLYENGVRDHSDERDKRNYDYNYDFEDDRDVSPRCVYLPTDMHLKYTDNPKLKAWLKQKNAEFRKQKKAERAKKREEHNEKMVEEEIKIARREKSAERVKEWMDIKRKEAIQRNREEQCRRKLLAQEEAKRQAARSPSGGVRGKGIDRPASAPIPGNKKYIPIKRPESAAKVDIGDGTAPKPPDSKFVYKRPVTGRVKLMKLQNERNTHARSIDQQRYEALSPEEKEKRARLSYDAWLVAKRKEDQQKKKEAARQKELIKSDPEMEKIIPELAKKRIERIKNGKKHIDTGMKRIDDEVNKSFGGGDFGEDGQGSQKAITDGTQAEETVPKPSSYKLAIDGSAATLLEVNTRARPVSAKTRMPIPQSTLSPRRPKSATPEVKAVMEKDHSVERNPSKLPFPDHLGVPEQVRRVQERIFSPDLLASANSEQRPEPQGCASAETASCPKGVDEVKAEPASRSSMVLLQEIEAAAVKSEEEAKTEKEEATASENGADSEDPSTAAPQEEDQDKISDGSEKLQEDEQKEEEEDQDDKRDQAEDGDNIEYQEEDDDYGVEVERTNAQQEEIPAPNLGEDSAQESPADESASADTDERPKAEAEEREDAETEGEQSGTVDNNTEEQLKVDKDLPFLSESEEDSESTRKSIAKHVSFSEEAPTVFKVEELPDTETSSNFDDERGSDDKDQYVSLFDAE